MPARKVKSRTSSKSPQAGDSGRPAARIRKKHAAARDTAPPQARESASAAPQKVEWLSILGATQNNLRNIDVRIPLRRFVCVTGVSGSGKSSLVNDILREQLARDLNGAESAQPGAHKKMLGTEHLDKVIDIDQSPIGRTPRSNPATYIKLFDDIRVLYAKLPESKLRGYKPSRFSFNVAAVGEVAVVGKIQDAQEAANATGELAGDTPDSGEADDSIRSTAAQRPPAADSDPEAELARREAEAEQESEVAGENAADAARQSRKAGIGGEPAGGRCEACEGNGATRIEMDFLADVWVTCPVCEGRRFNRETLAVRFRGKSIADVLDMDVQQALDHFANVPQIADKLRTLHDVGLDYLKLGQSSTTLSGGEAQRIKLAKELVRRSTGMTMYLLDEPTTGLHFEDVRRLLGVLHGFVDAGNSVVVIEHHLDVIKTADWVIDLGPDGGSGGGRVVVEGTPETVAACDASHTGVALRAVLGARSRSANDKPVKSTTKTRAKKADSAETPPPPTSVIRVMGAREHNLRDVTVDIPRNAITVCSGVSGSGKTSFAIDTVYTEGHRRYVESLSSYARQFLGQMQKPKVDHVHGLSPAIAIEQKTASKSPRSTVGTVTEIYDYMRVLWARLATAYCPKCQKPIGTQTADEIIDKVAGLPHGSRVMLCAPVERGGAESYAALFERYRTAGFARVRVDGTVYELSAPVPADERRRQRVQLVVDRVIIRGQDRGRLADSVEQCLSMGQGAMLAVIMNENDREIRFSQHFACDTCGTAYDELTPHHFSFNNRMGWCPSCEGLAAQRGTSEETIVVRPTRSLLDRALRGWDPIRRVPMLDAMIVAIAAHIGFDPDRPWNELSEEQRRRVLFGTGDAWLEYGRACGDASANASGPPAGTPAFRFQFKGFFPAIDEATRVSWQYRMRLEALVTEVPCVACGGTRVRREPAAARLADRTIGQVCALPLNEALAFFDDLPLERRERKIAGELLREITSRLRFLVEVGLHYISLGRGTPTLSGGEAQRIRLASQIGSGLTGVLYVLDEPTIGLHPRDNGRLISALTRLRDLGNTLLMVEHDREVIDHADHVLDFGPGAGAHGGRIMGNAAPADLRGVTDSLTGKYLAGLEAIAIPTNRRGLVESTPRQAPAPSKRPRKARTSNGDHQDHPPHDDVPSVDRDHPADSPSAAQLLVLGASHHNLKGIDVAIPLERFVCVTGVSGSGKSSLVSDTIQPFLARKIQRAAAVHGPVIDVKGVDLLDKVINVDQTPIGNSPLSNPATYTMSFDLIRELFAKLPDSKVRGYTANRFSFNRPGGRCESCQGLGQIKHEMHFLPDVWVTCDTCKGARYNLETLDVRYKGKSIADVLNLSVSDALELFANIPKLRRVLGTLADVGLDYVSLGQSAPTLSGGEAQRVKLALELGKPNTGRTIYILDEPTTGLHMHDVRKLLDVLHRLVDLGNSVLCVEHNLDVIKTADWVIDIGPDAGDAGGQVVVCGTPETVARSKQSHTGAALAPVLAAGPREAWTRRDAKSQAAEALALANDAPLELADADSAQMPWERNGRRWHTSERPARDGGKVEWDGDLLEHIVEFVQSIDDETFAPTDWSDRACVEIRSSQPGAASGKLPWFMHALTGGRWLLELSFRVPDGAFDADALAKQLKLKTLNERGDLPVYGGEPRVVVRPIAGGMQNIRLLVHDLPEVSTDGFKKFLVAAVRLYRKHILEITREPIMGQPWQGDGRAWHLGQKAMPPTHASQWSQSALVELLGRMSRVVRGLTPDWNRKTHLGLMIGGREIGQVYTNSSSGLRVVLQVPANKFSPAQLSGLGIDPEIVRGNDGASDTIRFAIRTTDDARSPVLALVMQVFTA